VEAVPEMKSGKRLELSDKILFVQDRKQIPIIYIDRIQISHRKSYSGIKSEKIKKTIVLSSKGHIICGGCNKKRGKRRV
jgi:hypothetical protein